MKSENECILFHQNKLPEVKCPHCGAVMVLSQIKKKTWKCPNCLHERIQID